jgi:hypothetical protein
MEQGRIIKSLSIGDSFVEILLKKSILIKYLVSTSRDFYSRYKRPFRCSRTVVLSFLTVRSQDPKDSKGLAYKVQLRLLYDHSHVPGPSI